MFALKLLCWIGLLGTSGLLLSASFLIAKAPCLADSMVFSAADLYLDTKSDALAVACVPDENGFLMTCLLAADWNELSSELDTDETVLFNESPAAAENCFKESEVDATADLACEFICCATVLMGLVSDCCSVFCQPTNELFDSLIELVV